MKIWHWARGALRNWFSTQEKTPISNSTTSASPKVEDSLKNTAFVKKSAFDQKSTLAQESLRELLNDASVPAEVREALKTEYEDLGRLLQKLEQEEIHIAVFGRVSVGKSSLLNALMGEEYFSVSALHGETRQREQAEWKNTPVSDSLIIEHQITEHQISEHQRGGVHFIDTPGIDEVQGDARELIARKAAMRADIILFVIDSDLTELEFQAIRSLKAFTQPLLLVLSKSDHFSKPELDRLLAHLHTRLNGVLKPDTILATSAKTLTKTSVHEQIDGTFVEQERIVFPDVSELKDRIWHIVENDGHTLAALNASLFASDLSDDVGRQVLALRRDLAHKVITNYSLSKGLAVAANPIPIADLVTAAGLDVSMIIHLSRLHGLPMSRVEAGELLKVIITQLAALMGTTWAIHALSAALKVTTAGLSTILTAAVQGSIGYYATSVLGQVAETWLAQGKSWGKRGPKAVVKNIMNDLDRQSILREGRAAILEKLGRH